MADPQADQPAGEGMMDSATPDFTQGYCIEVSVLPDGTFKVSGPEPLAEEAEEEQGEAGSEIGTDVQSIGEALKAVLAIVKANPVGDSDQAQFDAGYGSDA